MDDVILNVVRARRRKIFGVSWDGGSSPALTRTDSAVGMAAAVGALGSPVFNSFDSAPIYRQITEVIDALGNVFIRIPKFYIEKTAVGAATTLRISQTQHAGFYLPAVFWDFTNSRELPYFDFGKYKASSGGTTLDSKPSTFPLVNQNIVTFRTRAQANGAGYQQLDIHAHDVLSALFTVEFATLNSQAVMPGFTGAPHVATDTATVAETGVNRIVVTNAVAATYRVGQTIAIGSSLGGGQVAANRIVTGITVYDASNKAIAFDGATVDIAIGNIVYSTGWINGFATGPVSGYLTANDSKYPCAYRGIESPWGDVWQFVDGVNFNERQAWITPNAADYASNVFAAPYVQLGYVNGSTDGYSKTLGYDAANPFAQFPATVGGSSTTYFSDYYYSAAGQRIALVGGAWYDGAYAGLRYWVASNASSGAYVDVGGRVCRKAL